MFCDGRCGCALREGFGGGSVNCADEGNGVSFKARVVLRLRTKSWKVSATLLLLDRPTLTLGSIQSLPKTEALGIKIWLGEGRKHNIIANSVLEVFYLFYLHTLPLPSPSP